MPHEPLPRHPTHMQSRTCFPALPPSPPLPPYPPSPISPPPSPPPISYPAAQVAVLSPVYLRHRETIAATSHVVHKLVQSLVTVVPPLGTIYSPTYSPLGEGGTARPRQLTLNESWEEGRR